MHKLAVFASRLGWLLPRALCSRDLFGPRVKKIHDSTMAACCGRRFSMAPMAVPWSFGRRGASWGGSRHLVRPFVHSRFLLTSKPTHTSRLIFPAMTMHKHFVFNLLRLSSSPLETTPVMHLTHTYLKTVKICS